jgi:hypothetical protein
LNICRDDPKTHVGFFSETVSLLICVRNIIVLDLFCVFILLSFTYIIYIVISVKLYLSFIACSGSMREASCGSMMPAILNNYLLFVLINCLVPAAEACVRHPAGHAIIDFLFL